MRRRRRGSATLVRLLALAALLLTIGLLWRWVLSPAPLQTQPAAVMPSGHQGEEFSAGERQQLDDILRQKAPQERL